MSLLYLRSASDSCDALVAKSGVSEGASASDDTEGVWEQWLDMDARSNEDTVSDELVDKTSEVGAMLTAWAFRADSPEDFGRRIDALEKMVRTEPFKLILLIAGNHIAQDVKTFADDGELEAYVDAYARLQVVGRKLNLESASD